MWSVEYLPAAADEEATLPVDMQARLARMADTIRQHGLLNLPRDWVKPLSGKLWELRITGKDGIARAIYVTATGQRVVIVRSSRRHRRRRSASLSWPGNGRRKSNEIEDSQSTGYSCAAYEEQCRLPEGL